MRRKRSFKQGDRTGALAHIASLQKQSLQPAAVDRRTDFQRHLDDERAAEQQQVDQTLRELQAVERQRLLTEADFLPNSNYAGQFQPVGDLSTTTVEEARAAVVQAYRELGKRLDDHGQALSELGKQKVQTMVSLNSSVDWRKSANFVALVTLAETVGALTAEDYLPTRAIEPEPVAQVESQSEGDAPTLNDLESMETDSRAGQAAYRAAADHHYFAVEAHEALLRFKQEVKAAFNWSPSHEEVQAMLEYLRATNSGFLTPQVWQRARLWFSRTYRRPDLMTDTERAIEATELETRPLSDYQARQDFLARQRRLLTPEPAPRTPVSSGYHQGS
jgi:hypothetical protein